MSQVTQLHGITGIESYSVSLSAPASLDVGFSLQGSLVFRFECEFSKSIFRFCEGPEKREV